ncbi:Rhophilin-1 [Tupaia chinensis]|uniref:Rhophilin-1 n=1 Tax=Tupaia chinensis TaxID=246437 RepID=L9KKD2_TUPCH|nr:Rhophilin-1 [Tupaia chinensis]
MGNSPTQAYTCARIMRWAVGVCGSPVRVQAQRGRLQSRRARIHQQISKELRMRTGAENLYRATSNSRVRETVALELRHVNATLQLLQEELEELSSAEAGTLQSQGVTVPMIPLGLKETTELDWSTPLKELISQHFGEDGASYEEEVRELERLRQAMRTPSRSEMGLQLLTAYYNQLCFLGARFFAPTRSPTLLFHWYDSLTGVPAQQRALAFEKGSVLFNMGALHTQIGARQDRTCAEGASRAAKAFQRAAGTFGLLRENFCHAPSPDMSAASLAALERLMAAQAQECVFEGLSLADPAASHDCLAQLRLAQEAAQVAAEYRLSMARPPVRDHVPVSWTALVHVKAQHFCALAHYHAAMALCDGSRKAHLKHAILGQEEALRLHATCRVPREVDQLQAVLAQALRHSLAKYAELDREDDFFEVAEAPDVRRKQQGCQDGQWVAGQVAALPRHTPTHPCSQALQGLLGLGGGEDRAPHGSKAPGPLSVFSTKNQWRLVGPVHVTRGEGGFGFTLRGDSPVLIAAVIPGGRAAVAGLKEGDYIVSVNGQPCKWWKHADVVAQLKAVGEAGVSLQVVSLLPGPELPSTAGTSNLVTLLRPPRATGLPHPAPPVLKFQNLTKSRLEKATAPSATCQLWLRAPPTVNVSSCAPLLWLPRCLVSISPSV